MGRSTLIGFLPIGWFDIVWPSRNGLFDVEWGVLLLVIMVVTREWVRANTEMGLPNWV